MDDFDYDRWWSLDELGHYFNCRWEDLPDKSNGIIESEQRVEIHDNIRKRTNMSEPIFKFNKEKGTGFFEDTGDGIGVGSRVLKIVPNIPILDLSGVYYE